MPFRDTHPEVKRNRFNRHIVEAQIIATFDLAQNEPALATKTAENRNRASVPVLGAAIRAGLQTPGPLIHCLRR